MKKLPLIIVVVIILIGVAYALKEQSPKSPYTQQESASQEKSNISEGLSLEITEPIDSSTVNTSTVMVKGKTASNVTVNINDKEVKSDAQGNFSSIIDLDEGENIITVSANDDAGNYAEREITVTYNL